MEKNIATLIIAIKDPINLVMIKANNTQAPPAAAPSKSAINPPVADNGSTAAVHAALSATTKQLDKLETQGGCCRDCRNNRGSTAGGAGGGGDGGSGSPTVASSKKKPCCNAGRSTSSPMQSIGPSTQTRTAGRPNNYVVPLPGFGSSKK